MTITYKLHQYQTELVNRARNEFANGKKSVLIVSPAGSGKSVIIAEIARLTVNKSGRVLFMVHRKELVEQITESFKANDVRLDKCTIMTVGKIAHRLDDLPKPSLIITDETHHSLAKTYQKIYEYWSDVPRLGFTATPWRLSGKGFNDIYDSMIEGPTVKWLIDNNYLAPYEYYSVKLVDDKKLKRSSTGDYTNKSIDDAIGNTIFGDVIKTYQDKANGRRTIVYAHSIDFSKKVAQQFNEVGIKAAHCDAKTPAKEREQIMSDFKDGKLQVLCNVNLISEGFNAPDCSCVIMLRPTKSLVLDVQQSMRSMRYQPSKTAIIIDHVANYTRFGLPDTDREWSLNDRKKQKRSNTENTAGVTECTNCYAILPAGTKECPFCGYVIETEQQSKQIDQTAKIEKITSDFTMTANYTNVKYSRMKPEDAMSVNDLKGIQKARNYKPGWLYFQMKMRGWVKPKSH